MLKHWVSGDRCRLQKTIFTPAELSEKILGAVEDLNEHNFVSEKQANYLREPKSSLKDEATILLLDLAENCSFLDRASCSTMARLGKDASHDTPLCGISTFTINWGPSSIITCRHLGLCRPHDSCGGYIST